MNKRSLVLMLLLSMISATGCSHNNDSGVTSCCAPAYFDSTDELAEHFSEQTSTLSGDNKVILFEPVMPDDYKIDSIKLNGNNIYYTVKTDEISFSIGWNYTGSGATGLRKFTDSNSEYISELADHENVYVSTLDDGGSIFYWVQEDCFFQASIPKGIEENLISQIVSEPYFFRLA